MRWLHGIRHEQHQTCQRCGVPKPMSYLKMQRGLLVCTEHCFDNLDIVQRNEIIAQALSSGQDHEGADTRAQDWAWFAPGPEESGG